MRLPRNLKYAVSYYQKAINLGSNTSHIYILACYKQAYAINQLQEYVAKNPGDDLNIKEASTLFEMIAKHQNSNFQKHHIDAIVILAELYEKGTCDHPVDLEKAFTYYEQVYDLNPNHPIAKNKHRHKELFASLKNEIFRFQWSSESNKSKFPMSISSLIAQYGFDEALDSHNSSENATPKKQS